MKILFINPDKCVGCMACVTACSLQHGKNIGPLNSMILPIRLRKQAINIPVVCRQCLHPLCADVCPMGAITRDEATGAMIVDADLCIACGMCMISCPLGGISINTSKGYAVKCDLCHGDPLCLKFCTYGAIEYITAEEFNLERKRDSVEKLASMLEKLAL